MKKIFFAVFFISLVACSNNGENDLDSVNEKISLSRSNLEQLFQELEKDEIPDMVIRLVQSDVGNKSELEEWLLDKENLKKVDLNELSETQAIKLLDALYESELSIVGREWSYGILSINRLKEHTRVRGLAYIILAREYKYHKNIDSLSNYVQLLYEIKEQDTSNFINLSYHLHDAYLSDIKGNYLEALISYSKALDFVSKDDTNRLFTINQNMANLYIEMEEVDKAYQFIQESIRFKPWQKMPLDHLNTIGVIFRKYGDYEESEKVFLRLIDESKNKKLYALLAQSYSNYANLKVNQKKFDEAIILLDKSDSISQSIQLSIGVFFNLINRGSLYLNLKQYETSLGYYKKAYKLFNNFQIPKFEIPILMGLFQSYEGLNQKDLAYDYYKKYITQKGNIIGDATNTLIAEWKLSQSEYLNKINEAKLATIKKQRRLHQVLLVFILFTTILIAFFVLMYQRKRKTIKEQKLLQEQQLIAHQLELKTKELLSESINKIFYHNTKNNIRQELTKIIIELPPIHRPRFQPLLNSLKNNSEQKFLEHFEDRFVGVYESFYQKILEIAPTLTNNELRICSMMRINLTSKEIAMLTNRTHGTIENIRSNIRKKLNVPNHINLQDFILKL